MSNNKANNKIIIGYGGYGKIDVKSLDGEILRSVIIHISGASINVAFTRPMETTYNAPPNQESRAQIPLGVGVCNITGSVNFDFSMNSVNQLIAEDFLCRNNKFDLYMCDGRVEYIVYDCCWNSFTINASPQSLVTGSISFVALNKNGMGEPVANIESTEPDNSVDNYFRNELVAYWEAGANDVESFNITFAQEVTPVYLNNKYLMPTYLRCGALSISANIVSWKDWIGFKEKENIFENDFFEDLNPGNDIRAADGIIIAIAEKSILINNKVVMVKEYSHSGAGDVGSHSYTINGTVVSSSKDKLFEIL